MGADGEAEEQPVLGRAVRRHACPPHRRYRPVQDRRRKLGRLGRAPHRGADRRRRRGLHGRGGGAAAPGGGGAAHQPGRAAGALARLVEERRKLERELAEARRALASGGGAQAPLAAAKTIGDVAFDGRVVDDVPGRELRSLADDLKRQIGSGIVAVVSRADGKASIVVGVTDDLTARFDAVELVRAGAETLGGKGGGGRPDMAQAGGPEAARAEEALDAVRRALAAAGGGLTRGADRRRLAPDSPLRTVKAAPVRGKRALSDCVSRGFSRPSTTHGQRPIVGRERPDAAMGPMREQAGVE